MSKARVIVLSVVHEGLTKAEVARRYNVSWRWVHTLVTRYETGGMPAIEPQSRRPHSNSVATSDAVRTRIIELRAYLAATGLDAGPVTIAWHLEQENLPAPSTSTIRRILINAQLIHPEPKKRPKSSLRRFEADQPNECWQSDFTHWQLADGSDIEILNWLDDHSRYLISATAHRRVTGAAVIDTFTRAITSHGAPASTLTDNGLVYTARFRGGRNGFEYLLADLGIRQKNGHPWHPQTQGKIERFHQTLKRWLTAQPTANTIAELQTQLDAFHHVYNDQRPHRALNRRTPAQTYAATIKASPADNGADSHYRIRIDTIDAYGKLTVRRAGRLHHLGIGIHHANTPALVLIDDQHVTVTHHTTGQVLSRHTIDPDRNYWRNTEKEPGRWPNSQL
jgi:transposase InsO family protein